MVMLVILTILQIISVSNKYSSLLKSNNKENIAKGCYRIVVENIKYDNTLKNEKDLNSIWNNKRTSCAGYAYILSSLLNGYKIKNRIKVGTWKFGGDNGFHVWNEIYINKKWILVDATMGRFNFELGRDCFEWFNTPKKKFNSNHFED
jgi:transglutaminase/protease-like cytokinesis protein 3